MNLLTLQICKEEAEKMINSPYSWIIKEDKISLAQIRDQGHRTLEVINAYEHSRKASSLEKRILDGGR